MRRIDGECDSVFLDGESVRAREGGFVLIATYRASHMPMVS